MFLTFFGKGYLGALVLSKFIKIDYSAIENDEISVLDLVNDPSSFLIFDLKDTAICDTCHSKLTWKKSKNCVTLLCGCGCRMWFNKKPDGTRITKFVSKENYLKGVQSGKREKTL